MAVIDTFEKINVNHGHAKGAMGTALSFQFFIEQVHHVAAIDSTCQRIMFRQGPQFGQHSVKLSFLLQLIDMHPAHRTADSRQHQNHHHGHANVQRLLLQINPLGTERPLAANQQGQRNHRSTRNNADLPR